MGLAFEGRGQGREEVGSHRARTIIVVVVAGWEADGIVVAVLQVVFAAVLVEPAFIWNMILHCKAAEVLS